MQMENRIVSVHLRDRVGIVLGPGAAVFLCDINQALAHASLLRVLKEMNSLCGRHGGGSLERGTHPARAASPAVKTNRTLRLANSPPQPRITAQRLPGLPHSSAV